VETSAEDIRVLVGLLRLLRNWSRKEMAAATNLHKSTLSRYEDGLRTPDGPVLEKLARAAGVREWAVQGILLPAISLVRSDAAGAPGRSVDSLLAEALAAGQSAAANVGIAEFLTAGDGDPATEAQPTAEPREAGAEALDPWTLALPADPTARSDAPSRYLEYEALCDQLCVESVRAASDDAARSLELARMALRVAELAPGPPGSTSALEGTSWAFVGNAQRVGNDLPAAAASFASASRLWRGGTVAPGSRLAEWRLLDLEASLRRDQRRFADALDLLDHALAAAPAHVRGHILLNKSFTLEQAGEIEPALTVLAEAAPLAELADDPRTSWIVCINRLVLLCHLGRFHEADAGLLDLERITRELGNALDQLRTRWLTARIQAGLGWREEARSGFEEVRREFTERGLGYDTALVSLDLAILHVEAGRTDEVRALAAEMLSLFTAQDIGREALAALRLFCEAVASDTLTVEVARGVLASLERTQSRAGRPPFKPA
jgi:transcriptional regulator with XRE-family HTH domain